MKAKTEFSKLSKWAPSRPSSSKLALRTAKAFTLIETVIAIGIVSTVMVALVGLMPEGVKMLGQSGQRTVGARVAQELIGRIQLADFSEVEEFEDDLFYFDDQGTSVDAGTATRVYTAKVEVEETNVSLPQMARSEYLRRVIVKVSDNPGVPDFSDASWPKDYLRYSTIIVETAQENQL